VHLWMMTFVPLPPADTVLEVSRCYVTLSKYTDNYFSFHDVVVPFFVSISKSIQTGAWFLVAGHSIICMLLLRLPSPRFFP
jgi:hypothetical protein